MRILFWFIGAIAVLAGSTTSSQAVIYGMKSCYDNLYCPGIVSGGGSGGPPTGLFSFNEDGTGVSYLGNMNIGGTSINADALAISHNHGLLAFEVGPSGSRLLSVATNGSATALGAFMSGRNIRGATFDLYDNLIVLDAATSELIRIDPVTGVIIGAPLALNLGMLPYSFIYDGLDIAVRPDGTLLMVTYENAASQFYDVNPTTGALNLLHTDGVPEPFGGNPPFYPGITYSQSGGTTLFGYEGNALEDVFTYSSSWTRTHLIAGLPPAYNAGRGDLAALMPLLQVPTDGVPAPGALALLGTALLLFPVARRRRS